MLFAEIPGLEETKQSLIGSVTAGHIAHAQLFYGPEGSAGLALALAYATYINCENKGAEDACGECPSCSKMRRMMHPDFFMIMPISNVKKKAGKGKSNDDEGGTSRALSEDFMPDFREMVAANPYADFNEWANQIEAENKQLNIPVEEARGVIRKLSMKAFEAEYKIMVIWLAEYMRNESANALLKILEEPPQKTIFLLVSNNLERLITTILSRTQKVKVRAFSDEEVVQYLTKHQDLDQKKAQQVAWLADGNVAEARRLISSTDEAINALFQDWMRDCYSFKLKQLIERSESFTELGREQQKNLMLYGLNLFREALIFKLSRQDLLRLQEQDLKFIEGFSKALNGDQMEKIAGLLNEAFYHIERNANPKILFMDLSFQAHAIMKAGKA